MAIGLTWDATGEHLYETGVDHVVLYPAASTASGGPGHNGYMAGVAWNGVTGVITSSISRFVPLRITARQSPLTHTPTSGRSVTALQRLLLLLVLQ